MLAIFNNMCGKKMNNRPTFITIEYVIYVYNVQLKRPSYKVVYLCQMIDIFFRLYNPLPPRPKTPFSYVVYFYNDVQLSKEHLGSRGGGRGSILNKLKDTSFICSMTNNTILGISRTHAQKGFSKVLETKGIHILNYLVFLLLENL